MSRKIERRIIDAKIEVRTNADGTIGVKGYAAVFDSPAHGEVIKRSAFTRTLAQRDNVRFLINHEGTPLASTRAGTMTVGVDDHGLWFDIPAFDMSNPDAQRFCSAVARGDMYQCSFAGYFTDTPTVEGVREVREVAQLIDVSGVTYPWYDDTEMGLTGDRNIDRQLVSARGAIQELTMEQRARALHALRTAPSGKMSVNDFGDDLWTAIETLLDGWCILCDWGTSSAVGDGRATSGWAVYRPLNMLTYDFDDTLQIDWKQAADGTFTFGTPFEVHTVYEPMTSAQIAADDTAEAKSYTPAEARALLGLEPAA